MNPKSVFHQDKELVKWWVSVVHDPRFEKVSALVFASVAMDHPEHAPGAVSIFKAMNEFTEPQVIHAPFPSPGLIHETPKRIVEQPKTDKPKA